MGIWQAKNVDMSVAKIGSFAAVFCDIAKSDKFQTAKQNQTERQPTRTGVGNCPILGILDSHQK